MERIKIFKGNDTDFNNGQFLIFNISAVIDISSFSGIFKLGSFTATGNLKNGSMEIIIPNQITSQFPLGNMCGSFTLVDTKNRLATVSNTIPFEITNVPFTPQAATVDLDVPEGYPVNISMQLGVEYVKQSDYNDDKAAMQAEINGKQAQLTVEQLLAVNSGITSSGVEQIGANKDNITSLQASKQDNLTQAQLNAVDSGIDSTKVAQIATNENSISAINGKIPEQATTENQLADKNFVNSSIATNTANFIGTFNSLADLEAYSGTLTNNDYAFVIGTDADGNTIYNRYKYNGTSWVFEYALNNSSFTANQWAAINSGITSTAVRQISTNAGNITSLQNTKLDTTTAASTYLTQTSAANTYATQTALAGKQDTINDLDTIRSGAAAGATALQSVPYATSTTIGGIKIEWDSVNGILNIITED